MTTKSLEILSGQGLELFPAATPSGLKHSSVFSCQHRIRARRAELIRLYHEGKPFRVIAQEYGGTPKGVRSTVRKLRERGVLPPRQQPQRGQWA